MRAPEMMTRKMGALVVLAALAITACGPRTGADVVPRPARVEPADAAWQETLAAAKREGKVVVNGPTGTGYREALMEFQNAYPDITLELNISGGRDFAPKILAERRGDQFLWDVLIGGAGTPAQTLKPEGILTPLEPLLLPSIMDDSRWLGGFGAGFYDVEKTHVYAMSATVEPGVFVNRDRVSESELNRIEDLIDPRWRGRIVSDDVQAFGSGCGLGAHLFLVLGEDWLRQLFGQDLVITREKRQPVEWLVQGRYPIALAIDPIYLQEMQREGLGTNVQALAPGSDAGSRISQQSGALSIISNAPHPNATKVFVNWLLSHEGQAAWSSRTRENSRRLDVTEGRAEARPDSNRQYYGDVAREDLLYLPNECVRIGKEVIK